METQANVETVTTYLSWDHHRLDAILADVAGKVDAGRLAEAREAYRAFERGVRRHIRIEEELLFVLFEARTGVVSGPTAVLRSEHREIERAVGLMSQALERQDPEGFRDGHRFLQAVVPDHNAKEEHVLYPTTDRLLSAQELASFVARLREE
jgi:hemerythrin-like domain-containing protein